MTADARRRASVKGTVQYRLKDWGIAAAISGHPDPVIYCDKDGVVPGRTTSRPETAARDDVHGQR
jgi:leucyl-tRNA synthetase